MPATWDPEGYFDPAPAGQYRNARVNIGADSRRVTIVVPFDDADTSISMDRTIYAAARTLGIEPNGIAACARRFIVRRTDGRSVSRAVQARVVRCLVIAAGLGLAEFDAWGAADDAQ